MRPRSLVSLAEHQERLSKDGDPLGVLAGTVEFERFRALLTRGLGYRAGGKGGRPPFDSVAMSKVLAVQAQHNLSDARMGFMIRDRLSWMRCFDFDLGGATPDENTIRHYRNRLTESGTLEALMQAFEQQLREAGYLAMGGQIVDATLVPAPRQRNTAGDVWADSAYRSARNEALLKRNKLKRRIHHRKPKGKPMPEHIARANAAKSAIRAHVEHVFAHQKNRSGLFIRTIGLPRAQAKLTLANLACNFDRLIFHERCAATG